MTEDEAKTKVCCGPPGVSWMQAGFTNHCVGSACMAWRVRHMSPEQRAAMHRDEGRLHPEMSSDQLWSRVNACDVGDGYCGLAGRPE